MAELKPWQVKPHLQLLQMYREGAQIAIDSSDTGTGKTYVAAKLLGDLGWKALVICPKSSKTTWRRVVSAFGNEQHLLDVTNPEKLKTGKLPWWQDNRWTMPPESVIFWDEVHRGASGENSQQTRMLALTKAYRIPTLAISATIADSPQKLRGLGYLLGLHPYNRQGFYAWCLANGCRVNQGRGKLEFPKTAESKAIMLRLHQQMAHRMVRIRIEDVPDFPLGLVEPELFDIDSEYEQKKLTELWDQMPSRIRGHNHPNAEVQRLRARQRTEFLKAPIMANLAEDILQEGKSVVLFINFTETQEMLREALSAYSPVMIHGLQSLSERDAAMDAFQSNAVHVCICKIQAGGVSINLHDVHHERPRVSLISPSENSSELRQALGRIRRAGGTMAVQKIILLANTVEERVYRSLTKKLENLDALNDGDLDPLGGNENDDHSK